MAWMPPQLRYQALNVNDFQETAIPKDKREVLGALWLLAILRHRQIR